MASRPWDLLCSQQPEGMGPAVDPAAFRGKADITMMFQDLIDHRTV